MSVKHLKYTNKTTGETVRAIKVTERNFYNVAKWIEDTDESINRSYYNQAEALWDIDEKHKDLSNQRVKLRTPKGWRVAKVGDFVYRTGIYNPSYKSNDYDFFVGKDEFERNFKKGA